MGCEYQKDVTFDEVEVGDLILVECFTKDEGWYLDRDRRGTAKIQIGDCWYFDGMQPLWREEDHYDYRLFKVTDLSGESPEAELARLRKLEERIKDRIRVKERKRSDALESARKDRDQWQVESAHAAERRALVLLNEIDELEELLDT